MTKKFKKYYKDTINSHVYVKIIIIKKIIYGI